MNTKPAHDIIARAMSDQSVYAVLAARESQVSGRIFLPLAHPQASVEDDKVHTELRIFATKPFSPK